LGRKYAVTSGKKSLTPAARKILVQLYTPH
jgi:hypothetical protein